MTLPVSGAISINNVNVELNFAGTTTRSLDDNVVRVLFQKLSGAIDMDSGHGKSNTINLTIASDTADYNVFTAAGSPAYRANIVLTINSGVMVYASSTGGYALTTGTGWISGSSIQIINNGIITGRGGKGGAGGFAAQSGPPWASAGEPGATGGPGLLVRLPTTITNNGIISGGGTGGGGGGGGADSGQALFYGAGGGGGGGRPYGEGGTRGSSGSYAGPYYTLGGAPGGRNAPGDGSAGLIGNGIGGTGGKGGTLGAAGAAGGAGEGNFRAFDGGAGGAVNYSIVIDGIGSVAFIVQGTIIGPTNP